MARTYQQAMAGLLPDEPVLVVGQPTAIDPSRAPEGKHVLWVQVRMLPAEIAGDAAGEIAPDHWDEVKEAYADRVIAIIESYAPGLQQKILGRAVFSPLDLERENPNLVGGDQICGSHHLTQNFLFRPARGFAAGTRRSPTCIWSAPRLGRAPAPARDPASCSPSSSAGGRSRRLQDRTRRGCQEPEPDDRPMMPRGQRPTNRGTDMTINRRELARIQRFSARRRRPRPAAARLGRRRAN